MASTDRLRGFVGQGMNGVRRQPRILALYQYNAAGAYTVTNNSGFSAVAEVWIWGGGGGGDNGTGSGGSGSAAYFKGGLGPGQSVLLTVGAGGTIGNPGPPGGNSVASIPSAGRVMTAGGGTGGAFGGAGAGGVASGGDIHLAGASGTLSPALGGTAPSFPMSNVLVGGSGGNPNGFSPGGGGAAGGVGAAGMAVVVLWRKPR